jgi:DNA-binding response OmpR family regulator
VEALLLAMDSLEVADKRRYPDLIYVVEDDPDVSHLIEHNLRTAGYEVSTFFSGAPVVSQAAMAQPALFLLDIMLPGISGFDLCRQIRQHEQLAKTPIIFLSARTQEPDRLQAFDVGGDGYITKPFSPRELIARVRNVLRSQPEAPSHEIIQLGDLEIDIASMTVRVQGQAVWKEGSFVTPRSIDVFVRRLREKIEQDPRHPRYLKTMRGIGYRFESGR